MKRHGAGHHQGNLFQVGAIPPRRETNGLRSGVGIAAAKDVGLLTIDLSRLDWGVGIFRAQTLAALE